MIPKTENYPLQIHGLFVVPYAPSRGTASGKLGDRSAPIV